MATPAMESTVIQEKKRFSRLDLRYLVATTMAVLMGLRVYGTGRPVKGQSWHCGYVGDMTAACNFWQRFVGFGRIMRRTIHLVFCVVLFPVFLGSLTRGALAQPERKPLVLVSVYPIEAMVREIAGDSFDVRPALPYGRSEHDYEPSPKDVRLLRSADLLFVVDQVTDGWMMGAAGKKVPAVELLGRVDPETYGRTIGAGALGHVAAKSMSGQLDPHFWTDPVRMAKAARLVGEKLSEMVRSSPGRGGRAIPGSQQIIKGIEERSALFERRMVKLRDAMVTAAKGWPNAGVILAHGSLGYFSRITGLKIVGVLEPLPHMEPGPRHLRELIESAKANQPCHVLAEEQIDDSAARALAREANVRVTRINPLGTPKTRSADEVEAGSYDRYVNALVDQVGKGLATK